MQLYSIYFYAFQDTFTKPSQMLAQNVSPVLQLKTYVGKTETLLNLFSLKLCYNDLALVRLTADYGKASYYKSFQSHM